MANLRVENGVNGEDNGEVVELEPNRQETRPSVHAIHSDHSIYVRSPRIDPVLCIIKSPSTSRVLYDGSSKAPYLHMAIWVFHGTQSGSTIATRPYHRINRVLGTKGHRPKD